MSSWNERIRAAIEERDQLERERVLNEHRQREEAQGVSDSLREFARAEADRKRAFLDKLVRDINADQIMAMYNERIWQRRGVFSGHQGEGFRLLRLAHSFNTVIHYTGMQGWGGSDGGGTEVEYAEKGAGITFTDVRVEADLSYGETKGSVTITDGEVRGVPQRPDRSWRGLFNGNFSGDKTWEGFLCNGDPIHTIKGYHIVRNLHHIQIHSEDLTPESFSEALLEVGVNRITNRRLPREL